MRSPARHVIPINAGAGADPVAEMQRRMDDGDRTPELLAALAQAQLDRGNLDASVAASVELLEQNEVNAEALQLLGSALLRMHRWSEAGEAFDTILALDPTNEAALAGKAAAENQTEEPAQLKPAAQDDTHVEEGLASSAIATSDWQAVARYCSHLVQLLPDHFEAWVNLGVARHHLGEFADSEFAYRQALKVRPNSPLVYINLGILFDRLGDSSAAIDSYRLAHEAGDNSVTLLWNLALAEVGAGNPEGAETYLAELTSTHRDAMPEAWMLHARLAAERGSGLEAERALKHVVSIRPDWWEAHLNLGVLLHRRGAITEALTSFQRARELAPNAPQAILAEAAAALENGDMKRVSLLRRRLNELGKPAPALTFHLGQWLETQGRWDDAVRAYSEALKENPAFAEALIRLGQLLSRRGRPQEAADCWRRVLALRPDLADSYFDSAAC